MKSPNVLKKEDGFTLIEIIAVLILLGILAAVAIPKYMDLQDEARQKAAESAIAETKARLSMGYGQYLLMNDGAEPAAMADICAAVNDATVLPITGSGAVDMGTDYTVALAPNGTDAANGDITVSAVQGVALGTNVTDTWMMP